ncbi:MAG: Lrp/AsnC family transcriptional regulator [Microbacteriaceae bacterium]
MDDIDKALLAALQANARTPGAALASSIGIAESTVALRMRRLTEAGYIRGYHADIDVSAIGSTIQALIAVRLGRLVREETEAFRRAAPAWPGVLALFHMGGADDYLLHVAAKSAPDLRDFVLKYLAGHPAVAHTETNIIFEHVAGEGLDHLLA